MPPLNITLSGTLQAYVEKRVGTGRYRSPTEYLEALIKADQQQHTTEELTGRFLEGLNPGAAHQLTESDWKDIRGEVRKRLGKRSPQKPDPATGP